MRRSLGQEIFKTSKAFLYHGATDISDFVFKFVTHIHDRALQKNGFVLWLSQLTHKRYQLFLS